MSVFIFEIETAKLHIQLRLHIRTFIQVSEFLAQRD